MKIVAIVMAYQCADVILPCLQSLDGKVDEIMCFDGIWIGYDGPNHSDDGTDKVIMEFSKTSKSKVSYYQLSKLHQHEARTEALKHVNVEDWVITIDSDEEIVDWSNDVRTILENSTEKLYRVCWKTFKTYTAMPSPKCVRRTETVHYATDHRRLFDNEGEIDILHAPIIHIVTNHQTPMSEKKKMRKQADDYKGLLLQYENTHWNMEDKP